MQTCRVDRPASSSHRQVQCRYNARSGFFGNLLGDAAESAFFEGYAAIE